MQNVEWVIGQWVIPLRLLRQLEHLAALKSNEYNLCDGYLCTELNIDDWAAEFAQLKGRDIKGLIPHLLHSS